MMKVMATTIAFLGGFATKKATTGVNIIIWWKVQAFFFKNFLLQYLKEVRFCNSCI
jgi:hypothetical protein